LLTDSSNEKVKYSTIIARKWHFQDGTIAYGDSIYKTINVACPNSFWAMLVITDGIGCRDTLTIDVCSGATIDNPLWPIPDTTTGIREENLTETQLRVYPNPFTESFRVALPHLLRYPSTNIEKNTIYLYDLIGRQQKVSYQQKGSNVIIDGSTLPQGTYILHIKGIGRTKIVKQ